MNAFDLLFIVSAVILNILVVSVYLTSRSQRLDLMKRTGDFVLVLVLPFSIVLVDFLVDG